MKQKIIFPTLLIVITLGLIGFRLYQSSLGPHGGTVKHAGNYNIEMKNPYGNFYAYLLDKKLKPISNKGVSCEVKFFFSDNTNTDAVLKPQGDDAFFAETMFQYQSCRITFNVFGNVVSAQFSNETPMVQKVKK
ncbi:MAG: hypothetical protein HY840_01055 [Bacteroidetes bacterium]|nr:hypothetical protein [Bacteroidota bacterium]